jgi:hypothetical protein
MFLYPAAATDMSDWGMDLSVDGKVFEARVLPTSTTTILSGIASGGCQNRRPGFRPDLFVMAACRCVERLSLSITK